MGSLASLPWSSPPTRTTAARHRSSPGRPPAMLPGRTRAGWNHFGESRALLILEFRQAGRVIGIAPFFRRRLLSPGLGLSMLLPLGWEGNGLANGLTEQWELLFPTDCRMALLESLAVWLQARPWSTVLIPGFAERDPLPEWMTRRIAYR